MYDSPIVIDPDGTSNLTLDTSSGAPAGFEFRLNTAGNLIISAAVDELRFLERLLNKNSSKSFTFNLILRDSDFPDNFMISETSLQINIMLSDDNAALNCITTGQCGNGEPSDGPLSPSIKYSPTERELAGSRQIYQAIQQATFRSRVLGNLNFNLNGDEYLIAKNISDNIPGIHRQYIAVDVVYDGIINGIVNALPRLFWSEMESRIGKSAFETVKNIIESSLEINPDEAAGFLKTNLRLAGLTASEIGKMSIKLSSYFSVAQTVGMSIVESLENEVTNKNLSIIYTSLYMIQLAKSSDVDGHAISSFRQALGWENL